MDKSRYQRKLAQCTLKCQYCGAKSLNGYLFCTKHNRAIQKWIDKERRVAGIMWLQRTKYVDYICKKIEEYDIVSTQA